MTTPGAPNGKIMQAFWHMKGELGCPDLIPALLLMQEKEQGTTTLILKPGMKPKVSESNWWNTVEFPVRPLDEKASAPSDLLAPAPSQPPQHSTNAAL